MSKVNCHIWLLTFETYNIMVIQVLNYEGSLPKALPYWTLAFAAFSVLLGQAKKFLAGYSTYWEKKFHIDASQSKQCVFNLNDDSSCRNPSNPGPLPTMKYNSGILWIPRLKRWMVPLERAVAMGFPSHPSVAKVAGVKVDALSASCQGAARRIGNSFHIANAGMVLLSTLVFGPSIPSEVV